MDHLHHVEAIVVAFGVDVGGDFAAGGIEDGDNGIELGQGGFRGFDFEGELEGLFEVEGGFPNLGRLVDPAFEDPGDGERGGGLCGGGNAGGRWRLGLLVAAAAVELAKPVGAELADEAAGCPVGRGQRMARRRRGGAGTDAEIIAGGGSAVPGEAGYLETIWSGRREQMGEAGLGGQAGEEEVFVVEGEAFPAFRGEPAFLGWFEKREDRIEGGAG
ncbi:MAG: hypothetical protein ACK6D7_18000 [Acidobacteriota bacterium]